MSFQPLERFKPGSKVQVADKQGNVYSGTLTYINIHDKRICLTNGKYVLINIIFKYWKVSQ